jgi:hypothetical protein
MLQRMRGDTCARAWSVAYLMSGILAGGSSIETAGAGVKMRHAADAVTLNSKD